MATNPTIRRRIVLLNRLENQSPGRVAFVVYRTRSRARVRTANSYRQLAQWLAERQRQLATEHSANYQGATFDQPADATESLAPERSETIDNESDPDHQKDDPGTDQRPSGEWTKGQLYELARTYDLDGRSKLNKAELLDEVVAEWEKRNLNI